ncbi:MAG: hypothetical protein SWJ54_08195 [Cyanobacteriota bacterium]|nr:hypothetical protein [Cyanobacteriota bacterium]
MQATTHNTQYFFDVILRNLLLGFSGEVAIAYLYTIGKSPFTA